MQKTRKIYVVDENKVKTTANKGCNIPLNGCLYFFILLCLAGIAKNEYNRSKIRLESEKFKLEQIKKKTSPDTLKADTIKSKDTLPIFAPWAQAQKQKGF